MKINKLLRQQALIHTAASLASIGLTVYSVIKFNSLSAQLKQTGSGTVMLVVCIVIAAVALINAGLAVLMLFRYRSNLSPEQVKVLRELKYKDAALKIVYFQGGIWITDSASS